MLYVDSFSLLPLSVDEIIEIRTFNRFYTVYLGLLNRDFLNSGLSFPEGRVLQMIVEVPAIAPGTIVATLKIDKSYMSRILKSLEKKQLIRKRASLSDRRSIHLYATEKGKKKFMTLDQAASVQLREALSNLSKKERSALRQHLVQVKSLLTRG